MRVVSINTCNYGSTGNIMLKLCEAMERKGYEAWICVPSSRSNWAKLNKQTITIGTRFSRNIHRFLGRITGLSGCFSVTATFVLLWKLERINPDILHLHNLHNCYVNLPILFWYIKKKNLSVVWTLHDCWSFTGHCPHYAMIGCQKWKTHCRDCPLYRDYPSVDIDRSDLMFDLKKKWFTGMNAVLVTPSHWLASQIKQSFLKDYPVKVIHNGIDLDIFRPTESDFKQKYHCEGKKIVLGVSMDWGIKKGLDVFIELANRLPAEYQLVLVGGNEKTDQQLPANVISIHRTQNQNELAEIYTAADVFVNPTREDTFPTVNIESLACGIPIVTFATGGSPEILNETCGMVVPCNDVDALEKNIRYVCEGKQFSKEACARRAKQFDAKERFNDYIRLYEEGSRI